MAQQALQIPDGYEEVMPQPQTATTPVQSSISVPDGYEEVTTVDPQHSGWNGTQPSYLQNVQDIHNKGMSTLKEGLDAQNSNDTIDRLLGAGQIIGGGVRTATAPIEAGVKSLFEDPTDTALGYKTHTGGLSDQLTSMFGPAAIAGAPTMVSKAAGTIGDTVGSSIEGAANDELGSYPVIATPQAKAADIVDSFLAADKTSKGDVTERIADNQALGLPQTPIDAVTKTINGRTVAGRNVLSLARAAVATPSADNTLSEALATREANEGDRIAGHLDTHLSNNSFYNELDKNKQAMTANGVNYDAAYADPTPINTRPVQLAIRTPAGRSALAAADKMAQNEGATIFAENSTPKNPIINTQGADYFKRALDDQISQARQIGSKQAAASMQQIKNTVTEEADKINPNFALARQGHATPARQNEMMEQGREFNTQDPEEIADTVHGTNTTAAEKEAYLTGMRRNLKDNMSAGSDKSSPVNRIWKGATRDRLEAAMPTQDFSTLTQKMAEEQNMRNNSDYVLKGSQTAETTAAQNAIKEASNPGVGKAMVVAVRSALSPKYEAAKLGAEMLSQGLQKKIGGMTPEVASEIQNILANPSHPYWSMR